jgi:flagellin
MLSVQTNVSAITAQRSLANTSTNLGTAMERLSSGFRINRAADDAAGLAVSEKLKAQIGGLNQASRNAQDGISMIQTAEGALDEVQSMMQRMRDLAVQAASDTNGQTERDNINLELSQLQQEINSISQRTKFNGQSLLGGSLTKAQYIGTGNQPLAVNTNSTEIVTISNEHAATVVTSAVTVTALDVAGAQSGRTFLLSSSSAGFLTLTMHKSDGLDSAIQITDQLGNIKDISQTVTIADIKNKGSETFNFNNLGVSLTLASADTNGTAANIVAAFNAGGMSIDTVTGSSTAILQTGSNQGDQTSVSFVNTSLAGGTGTASDKTMDTLAATLNTFGTAATRTTDTAAALITALDNALGTISSSRAILGAAQNRLQHTISNLGTTSQNLSASNSRIRDVDVATESSNMSKNQVLEQAGVSVLAQANQLPQLALKLLG